MKPKIASREATKLVRFLCNYAGFEASKPEDPIPYKVREYGLDWVRVMRNGHCYFVPECITLPCQERKPKKVYEETWEGN